MAGYSVAADALKETSDGVGLNVLWSEFARTLDLKNAARTALVDLLTFSTTVASEPAALVENGAGNFERASEFGVPRSVNHPTAKERLGYPLEDFDLAKRYTWKYLRDATAAQVQSLHNQALAADNRLVHGEVLQALLDPSPRFNKDGGRVYGLLDGDGWTLPAFGGNTFEPTRSHYLVSGADAIDSEDCEVAVAMIGDTGFGVLGSEKIILLVNPAEGRAIRSFRAGVPNNNGKIALYDFIPSTGEPAWMSDEQIIGEQPDSKFYGLNVIGSYGAALVVEDALLAPKGYLIAFATAGPNSPRNVVALREHANPAHRGLLMVPGSSGYPLVDSYYTRAIGAGVRNRSAGLVMQIKASGQYVAPSMAVA